jgi:hypothetical protein
MKYDRTDRFKSDYKNLTQSERKLFRTAVQEINDAFDRRSKGGIPEWPSKLRIKRIQGTHGVWEMTWSFSGPDGRATFEIVSESGDSILVWRRIGGHAIFREP